MRKSDVIKLLGMLSAAYPNMKEVNEVTVGLWFDCLKDVDVEPALMAIKKHILESPYPPSIADIRKQIAEITTPKEDKLDAAEAWGEVVKAIQKYGSYREIEALESMSPTTRKVVKYMSWREICLSENIGVTRGQFLKMFSVIAEREKQDRLLPESFKEEIKQISENEKVIAGLISSMDMGENMKSH
mgnify:CR=1 FL=1